MNTINSFCTEKHKEYRDKCIQKYKSLLDRYDLSGKTNQEIGKEYYELLCAVKTNMILHDDLPTVNFGTSTQKCWASRIWRYC